MNKDTALKFKDMTTNNNQIDDKSVSMITFILAKNERLASAVYMVTSLLSDNEPIKWELRKQALCLLSELPLTFTSMKSGRQKNDSLAYADTEKVETLLREILSLINVALSGGSVSQMNLTILKQEYESLQTVITDNFSPKNFRSYLLSGGESSFEPIGIPHQLPQSAEVGSDNYNEDKTATRNFSNNTSNSSNKLKNRSTNLKDKEEKSSRVIKDTQANIPKIKDKTQSTKSEDQTQGQSVGENKNDRQATIINFLEGKGWTSIKDISRQVPDCSSKTVQRELVDMVKSGQIKKTGERRWSRYMRA